MFHYHYVEEVLYRERLIEKEKIILEGPLCVVCSSLFVLSVFCGFWAYYWGCARGFGRGTLYMKWGQQNQRFGTMRLRGEKDERKEKDKIQ